MTRRGIHDRPIHPKSFLTTSLNSEVIPIRFSTGSMPLSTGRGSKGCSLSIRGRLPVLTDDLPILLSLCSRSYCCNGGMALSNPGLEEAVTDRISFIRFSGSSLSSTLPDHSTLCRFRNSLLAQNLFERLFEEINRQREERGILVRESNGAILDATIVESSRRPRTVTEELSLPVISYSDDPDAT